MPKLNRQQRFAILKNVFNELGEKAFMRHAARLQVPADDARLYLDELKSGKRPAESEQEPERVERIERKPRQAPSVPAAEAVPDIKVPYSSRITYAADLQLKALGKEGHTQVDLLAEALNLLFKQHGLDEVA